MVPIDLLAWAAALGLGGVISALVNWLIHRNESSATTDSITVATAESVVDLVNKQLDKLLEEISHLEGEVELIRNQMRALARELKARGGDPDEVLREVLDKGPYKR